MILRGSKMNDKKYKTKEEWKEIINSISSDNFQQLCYDIINNNGFVNPQVRGKGADGGRDLEAELYYVIAGKESIQEKCWFQCKRQKQGVSFSQITTEVQKAKAQVNLRQWVQAKETAERLLKYNPEKSEVWTIKGQALRSLHQMTMAQICFQNAEKFIEKPISLLEDNGGAEK